MEPVNTEPAFPPEDGLARRLFASPEPRETRRRQGGFSPHESPSKRDPLHKQDDVWGYRPRPRREAVTIRRPRMGFCGALIFLALCLVALVLTVQFNSWEWHTIASQGRCEVEACETVSYLVG